MKLSLRAEAAIAIACRGIASDKEWAPGTIRDIVAAHHYFHKKTILQSRYEVSANRALGNKDDSLASRIPALGFFSGRDRHKGIHNAINTERFNQAHPRLCEPQWNHFVMLDRENKIQALVDLFIRERDHPDFLLPADIVNAASHELTGGGGGGGPFADKGSAAGMGGAGGTGLFHQQQPGSNDAAQSIGQQQQQQHPGTGRFPPGPDGATGGGGPFADNGLAGMGGGSVGLNQQQQHSAGRYVHAPEHMTSSNVGGGYTAGGNTPQTGAGAPRNAGHQPSTMGNQYTMNVGTGGGGGGGLDKQHQQSVGSNVPWTGGAGNVVHQRANQHTQNVGEPYPTQEFRQNASFAQNGGQNQPNHASAPPFGQYQVPNASSQPSVIPAPTGTAAGLNLHGHTPGSSTQTPASYTTPKSHHSSGCYGGPQPMGNPQVSSNEQGNGFVHVGVPSGPAPSYAPQFQPTAPDAAPTQAPHQQMQNMNLRGNVGVNSLTTPSSKHPMSAHEGFKFEPPVGAAAPANGFHTTSASTSRQHRRKEPEGEAYTPSSRKHEPSEPEDESFTDSFTNSRKKKKRTATEQSADADFPSAKKSATNASAASGGRSRSSASSRKAPLFAKAPRPMDSVPVPEDEVMEERKVEQEETGQEKAQKSEQQEEEEEEKRIDLVQLLSGINSASDIDRAFMLKAVSSGLTSDALPILKVDDTLCRVNWTTAYEEFLANADPDAMDQFYHMGELLGNVANLSAKTGSAFTRSESEISSILQRFLESGHKHEEKMMRGKLFEAKLAELVVEEERALVTETVKRGEQRLKELDALEPKAVLMHGLMRDMIALHELRGYQAGVVHRALKSAGAKSWPEDLQNFIEQHFSKRDMLSDSTLLCFGVRGPDLPDDMSISVVSEKVPTILEFASKSKPSESPTARDQGATATGYPSHPPPMESPSSSRQARKKKSQYPSRPKPVESVNGDESDLSSDDDADDATARTAAKASKKARKANKGGQNLVIGGFGITENVKKNISSNADLVRKLLRLAGVPQVTDDMVKNVQKDPDLFLSLYAEN